MDGIISIEHQLDIFINDLSVANAQKNAYEVLKGIEYLLVYRIKANSLLLQIKTKSITETNILALNLFNDFLDESVFMASVASLDVLDLCYYLQIHKYYAYSTQLHLKISAILRKLLSVNYFNLEELVKSSYSSKLQKLISTTTETEETAKHSNESAKQTSLLYPPQLLYYHKSIDKILQMYTTSTTVGLTETEITNRLEFYGHNKLPKPKKQSVVSILLYQITDFMVLILIVASIITLVVGKLDASIILWIVILANVMIGFTQELQANSALDALVNLSIPMARVIRSTISSIDASLLVPGDIVVLEEGDFVPADIRLIDTSQLEIVESVLTGESVAVLKSITPISLTRSLPIGDCTCNAFMSTLVARGRGVGVVVRTGLKTEIGKISQAITAAPTPMTNIQRKLKQLGLWLVVVAVVLSILISVIGIAWKRDVQEMLIAGISLAVSVIPEGLVAVVTVTMALGVRRMAKRQAIIRKLPVVETLGSVTVICSDKTGTLTEGKMGCAEMWVAAFDEGTAYEFTESTALDPKKGFVLKVGGKEKERIGYLENSLRLGVMCMSLCNNASVIEENGEWKPLGDPTEVALVVGSEKCGVFKKTLVDEKAVQHFVKKGENAFDSNRKLMSIGFDFVTESGNQGLYVFGKGAPEALLSRCTAVLKNGSGTSEKGYVVTMEFLKSSTEPMTDALKEKISSQSATMAKKGLRVLGLAAKKQMEGEEIVEDSLTFLGLVGLIDPPREGVREAVATCKNAGIRVVMITGDHIATASAIATQLGILEPDNPHLNRSMRGDELDLLSEDALHTLLPFPSVFARVSPENKLTIVKALQAQGHSVAMTGDGVNDAPAIKVADVGLAMGLGGTEITKQAADIVLANDNFTTIVAAVEEGRRVYDNIIKFIVYLLSCNSSEIFLMLICAALNLELPFTTIMILWANLIADVPPAMSISVEPAEKDCMSKSPRKKEEPVLSKAVLALICTQGLAMTVIALTVYLLTLNGSNLEELRNAPNVPRAQTLTFTLLTTLHLVQSFLSKSLALSIFQTNAFNNLYLVGAFFLSFGLLIMGVYTPGIKERLGMVPLGGWDWGLIAICVLVEVVLSEIVKLGMRRVWSKRRVSGV